MTDTDRELPEIIDATVLPPDEVERRRLHDVEVYGNAFVLKPQPEFPQWCLRALRSIGTPIFELDDGRRAVCVASRPLRAGDDEHVRRIIEGMRICCPKHVVSVSTVPPEGLSAARFDQFDERKLYGDYVDQIIMDEPPFEPPASGYGPPAIQEAMRAISTLRAIEDAYGLGHTTAIDALALKPRTDDLGPHPTQDALTPAKLTPAEARVARKLAGPWHDDKPWKHRKKGGR